MSSGFVLGLWRLPSPWKPSMQRQKPFLRAFFFLFLLAEPPFQIDKAFDPFASVSLGRFPRSSQRGLVSSKSSDHRLAYGVLHHYILRVANSVCLRELSSWSKFECLWGDSFDAAVRSRTPMVGAMGGISRQRVSYDFGLKFGALRRGK